MRPTTTKVEMPNCCGNCVWNDWQENGSICTHPANLESNKFELDIDTVSYGDDEETEPGDIHWDEVCQHHERGNAGTVQPARREYERTRRFSAERVRLMNADQDRIRREADASVALGE